MNQRIGICGIVLSLIVVATGQAVVFTEAAQIAVDDYTYDGTDVTVDGCVLTINGPHVFSSFEIVNGGSITHSPLAGLQLTITGDMVVEAGASINVDGKGYSSGSGPGRGSNGSSVSNGGGAGHGGRGGNGSAAGGAAYDVVDNPSMPGSGGGVGLYSTPWGSYSAAGGAGGGLVQISVGGELHLDGAISADGTTGKAVHTRSGGMPNRHIYYSGGGGSGGAVSISALTLSGNGSVTAVGGNGGYTTRAGGGAGGRIAITCDELAFDVHGISVQGGDGLQSGESGTFLLSRHSDTITLVRDMTIGVDETYFDGLDIVVDGCIVAMNGYHAFNSLQLTNSGGIVHSEGELGLDLCVASDLFIDEGCYISADGRGYGAGAGPGAGEGSGNGGGAGHGGNGGAGGAAGGGVYDVVDAPSMPGSGGGVGVYAPYFGTYLADGGAGGGLLQISVGGALRLDGVISANGTDGKAGHAMSGGTPSVHVYYSGGGGSGGAIRLDVFRLSGSGSISAVGGDGGWLSRAGGGAGGRIAIAYSDPTSNFNVSHIRIDGGNGLHAGDCGTIWLNGIVSTCEFAVWIEAPENDSQFGLAETITFEAVSTHSIPPVTYAWVSSVDGFLGAGRTLSLPALSGGNHTITLTGEDSTGVSNQDSIQIHVGTRISITSSVGGSVLAPGESVFVYDDVEVISVSASPDPGWTFAGWSGTAVGAGKVADPAALSTTVTVDADYTLHANFVSEGGPELPDLAIVADDIQLLAYDASDSTITIDAAIHNIGTATASGVTVRFYEFNTLLAETEVVEIPAGEMRSVPITIAMPAAGERLIQVILDPLDTVEELDETNNEATQILLINTGDLTDGYILITGSVPSSVCSGSSFSVTGSAVYDLYVDGVRYTDYAVKGGLVEMTVIGPDGEQWLYGGNHTNIYGTFSQVLEAPAALGIYRLIITVTDNTFIGECELVFEVKDCSSSTPPPGPPYDGPGGGGGGGGGSGYWVPPGSGGGGGGGGSTEWTWVWTEKPPGAPASDVYVYSENIHFSANHPDPEQEITIFAEIRYWAESTILLAQDVPINIYATFPGEARTKIAETVIDELTVGGPDFGSQYVFTTWKTNREGIYIIEVEVDPSYSEQNMLNNAATRAIIVGDLGHPWGAIEGQVREALGGVDDVIMDLYNADHTILIESKITNNGGYYLFTNLSAGTYQVHIRVPDGYVADAQTKPAEVVAQSITTVNFFLSQSAAPVADAGGPYSGEVGLAVTLDASGSYDPDGVIVKYEWDCSGDGEYDQITSSSQIPYTWDTAYNGTITLRVTDDDGLTATDTATVTMTSLLPCGVDIYPNRIPNEVYLSTNYTIYVALLGAEDFAVTDVDSSTVRFGRTGAEASAVREPTIRDLNGDGFDDAMYGFMTFDCGFDLGDSTGILTGQTTDGTAIRGTDSISVQP